MESRGLRGEQKYRVQSTKCTVHGVQCMVQEYRVRSTTSTVSRPASCVPRLRVPRPHPRLLGLGLSVAHPSDPQDQNN